MLLNISNHPYSEWSSDQKKAAASEFGSVQDLPHPVIAPEADAITVLSKANELFKEIDVVGPDAVHIMGEHTFCHVLINLLQQAGYRCLASTTRRSVEKLDNSEIRRVFEFVRFRDYPHANSTINRTNMSGEPG
ncbi:MAG: CRISPR-associated protein [Cyclonatronaceae bacterium]